MEAGIVESVRRQYGETVALDGVSLSIETGEVRVRGRPAGTTGSNVYPLCTNCDGDHPRVRRRTVTTTPPDEAFLARAARWASSLTRGDIPAAVCEAALAQRASTLGAAVWTTTHPVGRRLAETTHRQYGSGPATFLGDTTGLTPAGAAYGNAALSMALDFDDTVLGGHTGHSAVFAALAYAEALDATQGRALVAQVAATEVAARVGSAAAIGPFRGQQAPFIHAICGAVARAVVAGDDPDTLRDALGIALAGPDWPLDGPFFAGDSKHWLASDPLRTGLAAVDAARAGGRGYAGAVEGEGGLLEELVTVSLPAFLGGFGERWHSRAVTVKTVPGCAYVTAPVEAALEIADRADPAPAEIDSVTVRGSLFATEVDERAAPYLARTDSPLPALSFTVAYNVAVALADGEHTPAQFDPDRVGDESVWRLADRVSLVHDERFTIAALESTVPVGAMLRRVGPGVLVYAARTVGPVTTLANLPTLARFARKRPLPTTLSDADKRMGARVEVTTGSTTRVATVEHPTGFAGHPLAEICDVARRKYREALVAAGVSTKAASRAVTDWTSLSPDEPLPGFPRGTPGGEGGS
jgi:2-methylcitrate dehydratase PrpD